MLGILHVSCSYQQMWTSNLICPLHHLVPILVVMLIIPELLVSEVSGDVEERQSFGELFSECLHIVIIVNYGRECSF